MIAKQILQFQSLLFLTIGPLLCQTEGLARFLLTGGEICSKSFHSQVVKSNFSLEKKQNKSLLETEKKTNWFNQFFKKVPRERKKQKTETNREREKKLNLDSAFEAKDSLNIRFSIFVSSQLFFSSNQPVTCRQNDIPLTQKVRLCDKTSHK